ncbi:MAG: methyltransferase domain-containing protein [Chloroflexales bacterium]|nr:methyltransferase domain-containing protein [Chloroflexales bacterium]
MAAKMIQFGAGGYDWLDVWRRMYDAEREQAEAATDPAFEHHVDEWTTRATRFARVSRQAPQPDGFMQFLLPRLRATDTVLDLGAGAGRYIPLLSRAAAQVIALEPSGAMRAQLERRLIEEQLHNVDVIAAQWPTECAIAADVVISAHVAYAVREIGPFLEAMTKAARRSCYLYLGLQHPTTALSPFWERFHGMPRLPLPAAMEAFNALHQLNIPAAMELVPLINRFSFNSADEALHEIRHRLRYAPAPRRDAEILAAITEILVRNDDGSWSPPALPRHAAVIWWPTVTIEPVRS